MVRVPALIFFLAVLFIAPQGHADTARIAVAGNFTAAAKEIAQAFSDQTDQRVLLSFGSTGKLFAQITQGAPFDAFLSADQPRPARTVEDGLGVEGTLFTYAIGRLVLFSIDEDLVDGDGTILKSYEGDRFAIANPRTAPYGAAATEVLTRLGVLNTIRPKLVRGDNIAQTYQFVATGNAPLGFVALSQVIKNPSGSRWVVPEELYTPLRQDAVLLTHGADNPTAKAFLDFLRAAPATEIMARYGYGGDE